MYFFPYNDSTSSLPIRSWSYFPKVSAEVFHGGSFFVSHRGSVSSSEIRQLNSTELCWKISCSGEWELLLNKGEKKKKALALTKNQHKTKQKKCSLKEAKTYLKLSRLLKICERKPSLRWQKPTGLFFFFLILILKLWNEKVLHTFVLVDFLVDWFSPSNCGWVPEESVQN